MKTLIIDNYDSYTFNLYQMVAEINQELPIVVRNDRFSWSELEGLGCENVVISPGPGHPSKEADFGVCRLALSQTRLPVLGVCLGHQGLGYFYGAAVIHAPEIMHGRLSTIFHNGSPLFKDIPPKFRAVRYHSFIVADPLPDCLEKIAWTEDNLTMALHHKVLPFWGVQFHPESICTEYGDVLLKNFRDITLNWRQGRHEQAAISSST